MQNINGSGLKPLRAEHSADNRVCIEFTQQEVDALSYILTECDGDIDCYDIGEEHEEVFASAIRKIFDHATPSEPETMLVPDCIFPPGFADQLISMGLARRATPEEVREEFARYEQGRIG